MRWPPKAGYETVSLRLARSLATGRYGLSIDKERAQRLASQAITAYEVKAANGSGTAAKVLGVSIAMANLSLKAARLRFTGSAAQACSEIRAACMNWP